MSNEIPELTENLRRAITKKNENHINKYIKKLREKNKLDIPIKFAHSFKITLLSYFAINANTKRMTELLSGENAASVQALNENGTSTLIFYLAWVYKHPCNSANTIIDILLQYSPEAQLLQLTSMTGSIPLQLAVIQENLQITKKLLQYIPDQQLKYRNSKGLSIFQVAYTENKSEAIKHELIQWLILTYPVILEVKGSDGVSPLHLACANGDLWCTQLLLLKNPQQQVLCKDDKNNLPIILACENNYIKIVEKLLKFEPEKQISTETIVVTCLNGGHEILQRIFQTAETLEIELKPLLNNLCVDGISPLHSVIFSEKVTLEKKLAMLELLLKIDPEEQLLLQTAKSNFNPLHVAIEEKCFELVEKLTACPNQKQYLSKNNNGDIPLYLALKIHVKSNKYDDNNLGSKIIALLLERGPQEQLILLEKYMTVEYISQKNDPLTLGIVHNHLTFVEIFVKSKTSEELLSIHQAGVPLLHLATLYPEMLNTLLKADTKKLLINLPAHNYKDSTPLDTVQKEPDAACIYSISSGGPLSTALIQKKYESVDILISSGADVAQKDNAQWWTPLHYACEFNHFPSFQLMQKCANNLDILTKQLFTPLHIACRHGNLRIVEALIKKEASINCVNIWGETSLYIAIFYGYHDIVKLLLDSKADPNITKQYEQGDISPLILALQKRDIDMTRLLLIAGANIHQPLPAYDNKSLLEIIKNLSAKNKKFFQKIMEIIKTLNLMPKQTEFIKEETPEVDFNNTKHFTSARTFLLSYGYKDEDIMAFEEERGRNQLLLQKNSHQFNYKNTADTEKVYNWGSNSFSSKDDFILSIASPGGEAYCYLDATNLEAQGCDTSKLNSPRLKFSGHQTKKLDASKGLYSEWVKLPHETEAQEVTYTHELKIKLDRILLFPVKADNGSISLYVGTRYIAGGLHTLDSISSLRESLKSSSKQHFLQVYSPKVNSQKEVVNAL